MDLGDWIGAVASAVQVAAILVAGIWAYYKFVRGRTFHRRAEIDTTPSLLGDSPPSVRVKASLRNTGAADIPLRAKTIRVSTFERTAVDDKNRPNWHEIAHGSVFTDHERLESQETITDDVVIPLPEIERGLTALLVKCIVYEKRKQRWYKRKRGGGVAWTSTSVLPLRHESEKGGSPSE